MTTVLIAALKSHHQPKGTKLKIATLALSLLALTATAANAQNQKIKVSVEADAGNPAGEAYVYNVLKVLANSPNYEEESKDGTLQIHIKTIGSETQAWISEVITIGDTHMVYHVIRGASLDAAALNAALIIDDLNWVVRHIQQTSTPN